MKTTQPLTSQTRSVAENSLWALLAQDVTHCPFRPKNSTTSVTPNNELLTRRAFGYSTTTRDASRTPASRIPVQNSSISRRDISSVPACLIIWRLHTVKECGPLMVDFVPNSTTQYILPLFLHNKILPPMQRRLPAHKNATPNHYCLKQKPLHKFSSFPLYFYFLPSLFAHPTWDICS